MHGYFQKENPSPLLPAKKEKRFGELAICILSWK